MPSRSASSVPTRAQISSRGGQSGEERADRRHPTRGEAPPADGQQAQTTVVLAAHAHQGGRRWRDDAPKRLQTACLKCADVPRANFTLMKDNIRCASFFHLLVPGGL
jgi:hypothetical protein